MKRKRQEKIILIIEKNDIETQEELTNLLSKYGFNVTQATVSRDIKELKLVKILSDNGRYKYSTNNEGLSSTVISGKFISIVKEGVINIDYAMNIVVIKCYPGMANAVCAAIDNSINQDIVGSIAGDDTIFITVRSEQKALDLVREFSEIVD